MFIKFKFDEVEKIVEKYLIPKIDKYKFFTFKGPLGAGKTTLIRQILRACGVKDLITSPTFNYVNKYDVNNKFTLYHFDLYRLNSLQSFFDSGFDEYFYNKSKDSKVLCFVEWPEIIKPFLESKDLKGEVCHITLSFCPESLEIRGLEIL